MGWTAHESIEEKEEATPETDTAIAMRGSRLEQLFAMGNKRLSTSGSELPTRDAYGGFAQEHIPAICPLPGRTSSFARILDGSCRQHVRQAKGKGNLPAQEARGQIQERWPAGHQRAATDQLSHASWPWYWSSCTLEREPPSK